MTSPTERNIYIKVSRSQELLSKSIETYQGYLLDDVAAGDPIYYRARHFLKEGKVFFEETLKEAKKLLGSIPVYAAKEFEEWKASALEEKRIIIHGESPDELKAALMNDEFIRTMMSEAEIEAYVRDHFETQRSGKRKLANIKVRMMLDKLLLLAGQGQELQKAAQKKHQAHPA
ncbi:MAG: hypothetical protein MUP28_00555 [Candidatus Aminicenantes bacterium]|nr:hypothetical protein [Candidatus Aminicenantes bacterium]